MPRASRRAGPPPSSWAASQDSSPGSPLGEDVRTGRPAFRLGAGHGEPDGGLDRLLAIAIDFPEGVGTQSELGHQEGSEPIDGIATAPFLHLLLVAITSRIASGVTRVTIGLVLQERRTLTFPRA